MLISPFMLPDNGYEPPVPELNQEEGMLDISAAGECTLVEESQIVAEILVLRCVVRPIPLRNDKVHVQLIAEGEGLESASLYADESIVYGYKWERKDSCWQAVALDYTGIGKGVREGESFAINGNTLPFGEIEGNNPLYIKPFNVEFSHYQERVTSLLSGQVLRSPPGVLDSQFLRGYGGYYKEGIGLADIQQVYYNLTSTGSQTRIRLINSTTLHEQHTPPPHGGQAFDYGVQFIPTLREEEYLSLSGALAAGYARLSVSSELGLSSFSSFFSEAVSGFPNLVNVSFREGIT